MLACQPIDVESPTTNEDNRDLATNHYKIHTKEKPVLKHAFENVEFIVKTTIAAWISKKSYNRGIMYLLPLVEYLHPHESIKYESLDVFLLILRILPNTWRGELQNESDCKLI